MIASSSSSSASSAAPLRIAIIGAGLSGISQAIALTRLEKEANNRPIEWMIYERADRPGGTWRDNNYPGCACDVSVHFYSLSTDLNPNWDNRMANRADIHAYWEGLFEKYDLGAHAQFNTEYISSVWDPTSSTYTLTLKRANSSEPSYEVPSINVLISAVGGFSRPVLRPPSLVAMGLNNFKGGSWHTNQWEGASDFSDVVGKRVGIVGNGASGVQAVSALARMQDKDGKYTEVINFARSKQWYLSRPGAPEPVRTDKPTPNHTNVAYPPWLKGLFATVPGLMRAYRWQLWLHSEALWCLLQTTPQFLADYLQNITMDYLNAAAPEQYREKLIPEFRPGAKRLIADPGYLEALHWSNTRLVQDGMERIVEDGVVTKTGEFIPLDYLVLATGFDVSSTVSIPVHTAEQSLYNRWEKQHGPQAYMGTTVPGFPNFFMLLGPNSGTGHTSVVAFTECQIGYIMQFLRPMVRDPEIESFEVKEEAETTYNEWLQERISKTAYADQSAKAWYATKAGKVTTIFPASHFEWAWTMWTPVFDDYVQRGGKINLAQSQARRKMLLFVGAFLLLLLPLLSFFLRWDVTSSVDSDVFNLFGSSPASNFNYTKASPRVSFAAMAPYQRHTPVAWNDLL